MIFTGEAPNPISAKKISSFTHDNDGLMVHTNKIISINSKAVTLYTQTGALLTSITSTLNEGEPIGMDVTNNFLTIFTMEGYVKIFDLSDPQPKLVTPTKSVQDLIVDFGEIIQAKTNASANQIALTIAAANLVPDGKLYVYDIENNEMFIKNFRKQEENADKFDTERNDDDEDVKIDKDEVCLNRIPINFFWDKNDPRLLICDARKLKTDIKNKRLMRSKSNAGRLYEAQYMHTKC